MGRVTSAFGNERFPDSDMVRDARALGKEAAAASPVTLRNPFEAASTDPVAAVLDLGPVIPAGKSSALEEVAAGVKQVILTSTPLVVRQKLDEMVAGLGGRALRLVAGQLEAAACPRSKV